MSYPPIPYGRFSGDHLWPVLGDRRGLYLAIRNLTAKWDTIQGWKEAMNRFRITDGERIDAALALGA